MSYMPSVVEPRYATLSDHKDFSSAYNLKFPDDKRRIARLSLLEMQVWFAANDPQQMMDAGIDAQFERFWFWNYLVPLWCKRAIYRLKFW